jgi:hypothetical protein
MSFGKIPKSTYSASEEIEDFYDVYHLNATSKELIQTLASKVRFRKEALTPASIYRVHQDGGFSFKHFKSTICTGSPITDWLYYADAIYTDLIRRVKRKEGEYAAKFLRENKEYAVIIANWVFNNHLFNYGLHYNRIHKSICLYYSDPAVTRILVNQTYELFRSSGCFVGVAEQGSPLVKFPSEKLPTVFDLHTIWERQFLFLDGSGVEGQEQVKNLKQYICNHDGGLLMSFFPVILVLSETDKSNTHRKFMLEFTV